MCPEFKMRIKFEKTDGSHVTGANTRKDRMAPLRDMLVDREKLWKHNEES